MVRHVVPRAGSSVGPSVQYFSKWETMSSSSLPSSCGHSSSSSSSVLMRRLMMTRAAIPANITVKQAILSRVVMSTEVSSRLPMSGEGVSVVLLRPVEVKLLGAQAEEWALIGQEAVDIIGNPYMYFVIRMRIIMTFVAGESS